MPIIKLSLPAGSHAVTLADSETLLVDVPVEYSTQSPSPPPHVVQDAQTQTEQAAGEKRVYLCASFQSNGRFGNGFRYRALR